MRTLFSGILALGVLSGQMAAAGPCARPSDKAAFGVEGLKSELMVTALACHAQDRYNEFVGKFRPDLVRQERALDGYFGRAFGRRAREQHDEYITSLANAQSEAGIRLGAAYCQQQLGRFEQVMALTGRGDLPRFALGQPIVQPLALVDCAPPVHRTRTALAAAGGRRHH